MSIYDLKPRFQNWLRPLCRGLAVRGVTPNQVTLAALMLSAAAGACIAGFPTYRWPLLLLPAALFLRMALNAIDGMLAREHDLESKLGAMLNEVGDGVSDVLLYLPLVAVPGVPPAWTVTAVVLAGLTELTGLAAAQVGSDRRYDGPMGKSDRAFVFGALGLLLGLGVPSGVWVEVLLIAMNALLAVTVWNRGRRALEEVS